ncbi:hypothetical protein [Piscinibacter terrae]|uniref:hypothetical protein n=1 Tax=Piscinibacter terrae TaxID=2496871 RepID=UPI000F59B4A4|nr:hypothetical protein [Albitalea terrae]
MSIPLFVSGCASIGTSYGVEGAYNAALRTKIEDVSKLPEQEQLRLREVKFIESTGLASIPKGEVVGLACKLTVAVLVFKWTWRPELNETNGKTPEEAARVQLLLKAMQRGANAVVAPSCTHKDGIDWGNNCFESWVCTGQAVWVP